MKIRLQILLLLVPIFAFSQPSVKLNQTVLEIIQKISADSIKRNIEKLVSFHTRHSLSDTSHPSIGIGSARRWLKSELERYSRQSGGRLKVEFDEFIAPQGPRVPKTNENGKCHRDFAWQNSQR
jgi:hypothetical protein